MKSIPPAYLEAYKAHVTELIRTRVPVLCLTASFLFYAVSSQYILREKIFGGDTFRPLEFIVWGALAAVVAGILFVHARSRGYEAYRRNAFLFNLFFMACLTALALVYPENATVFPFYYAFTLLLTQSIMPWSIADMWRLSIFTVAFYTFYYFFVKFGLGVPVYGFSRFHPYVDGCIFIAVANAVGFVMRREQLEHFNENFVLSEEMREKNRKIESELQMAAKVHATLVPASTEARHADIAVTYIPVGHIGGDYATYRFREPHRLLVFMSDVSGHGVPAALLANRVHVEFERLAAGKASPGEILSELSVSLMKDFDESGMFMSAICAQMDFDAEKLVYASYGHPDQFLHRVASGGIAKMDSTAGLLGGPFAAKAPDVEREVAFKRGDSILFFTDGIVEAMNPKGEQYGDDRLGSLLRGEPALRAGDFNARLIDDLRGHSRQNFRDDIFVIHVKTKPVSENDPSSVRSSSTLASSEKTAT